MNTGAFDPLDEIATAVRERGRLAPRRRGVRPLGAAAPALAHLAQGAGRADSWATDGHKWLNVPYDSGIVIVNDPQSHRRR